ncbi:MAG: hypothetical protein J6K17_12170 [Oscillospiraceae bacterium]|nr:hypothetical protein [Oscillospiraceae bacterium]
MNKKILALLTSAALCLTGCSAKITIDDADEDVLELLEDCDYDIEDFSEVALTTLYSMDMDEFLALHDMDDEDEFEEYVYDVTSYYDWYNFDSKKDMEKALNATLEDTLLVYKFYSAYLNSMAVGYLAETYAVICDSNDVSIDDIEFSGKIKAKSPSGKVKFNGEEKDLNLFIQQCINEKARNGYYYVELDDSGETDKAYWSDDKDLIKDDSNFEDEYEYDLRDIAEGEPIICGFDSDFTFKGTNAYKIAKKQQGFSDYDEETFINNWFYLLGDYYLEELILEEVNDNIEDIADDNFVNPHDITEANSNAKAVNTAAACVLTLASIDGYDFGEVYSFGNESQYELENIQIGNETFDFSEYLGSEFPGYFYVTFNPNTYSVYTAMWSEDPIPDKYKVPHEELIEIFDEDEQMDAAKDGNLIGIHPSIEYWTNY